MKLIDVDALDIVGAEVDKSTDAASFVKGMKHVIKQLNNAPTADAIPVVKCGECKHGNECQYNGEKRYRCEFDIPDALYPPDFYCAHGERKGNT